MADTYAERVARGAALLDDRRPGWWREDRHRSIDLDELDIDDCTACVLGQLYRTPDPSLGYDEGLGQLGITARGEAATCGFIAADGLRSEVWQVESDRLGAEWSLLIAGRRDAASVAVAGG